jgi:hypothetical protein
MHSGLVIKIKYGPFYFQTKLHVTAQCAFVAGGAQLLLCFWTIFEIVFW